MYEFSVIIPVSGGIDSASVAYNWLKSNPNEKALLLNIQLKNAESKERFQFEQKAIHSIVGYFKEIGITNFEIRTAQLDYESAGSIPPIWDIEAVNFMVGIYMRGEKIRQYIKGTNKDDFEQPDFEYRLKNSNNILEQILKPDIIDFEILYPNKNLRKSAVIDLLPNELTEKCWSCRAPFKGKPCGNCDSCLQNK